MKTVTVRAMGCEFTSEGFLCVEKIACGVGVILFNPQRKFAAGFHVFRGHSKGQTSEKPGYFADTALDHVLQEFTKRGIPLDLSVAVAGGASLLAGSDGGKLGLTLVQSVKEILAGQNLQVKVESVGGNKIRSIVLNVDEGKIKIA